MRKLLSFILGVLLLAPLFCIAKEKKKVSNVATLLKYDVNKDGTLQVEEIEALKKDFADNKTEGLKRYDVNGNGKIDEDEMAAIKTDFATAVKQHKKK